jgi:MFS transporter, DHA2 family, multidrug resistance protein
MHNAAATLEKTSTDEVDPACPEAPSTNVRALPMQPAMSDSQRLIAFIAMTVGMFMASLDIQIVASSIAEIQAGLSATADEISLVQTSYLIAEVIMIPMSGWLSRMLSTRWLFAISAAGFTMASVACAMAWNIESMVVFRALQGFIGGAMIPTVFAAGFAMFPGPKQTRIPAVLGLVATLAPALGPSLGGMITDVLSWRWLFFINVVPGVLITFIVPRILRIDRPDFSLARRFDLPGALCLAVFLGCLQYILDEGPRKQWFENSSILTFATVSGISGMLFIWRSLSVDEPIVDLRAFRSRNFTLGCAFSFVIGIGLYGSIYLTPLFLGQVRHFNAQQIGTTVFVVGLCNIAATPFTVVLLKRVDVRLLLFAGFALFAVSSWMFSSIDATWGSAEVMIPQGLRGIATMVCIIPVTGLALGALPPESVKGGSGLYNLMRNLGGAIGLALISSNLFYDRMALHYQRLMERVSDGSAAAIQRVDSLAQLFGTRLADSAGVDLASVRILVKLVQREALVLSFIDVFLMLTAVFLLALLLIPFINIVAFTRGAAAPPPADH